MITFFHGLIGSPHNWDTVLSFLSQKNITTFNPTLKYIDQTLLDIIEDIQKKYCGLVDVKSQVAVGNSLGCLVALGVAQKVDTIILTAPPFQFDRSFIPREKDHLEEYAKNLYGKRKKYTEAEMKMFSEASEQFSHFLSDRKNIQKLKRVKKDIVSLNMQSRLQKFQKKIHFVLGSEDTISPLSSFLTFQEKYAPQSKLSIIENCGHAVPLEQPSQLAKIIEAYI